MSSTGVGRFGTRATWSGWPSSWVGSIVIVYSQVTNDRIGALIDNLRAHLTRIGRLTEDIPGRVEASVEEHAAIVEAILARNPDEAERLMRVHIASVLADQLATRETSTDGAVT